MNCGLGRYGSTIQASRKIAVAGPSDRSFTQRGSGGQKPPAQRRLTFRYFSSTSHMLRNRTGSS